ncbi:MAG: Hpt domain-containing protein [Proteobacteria bacterium]|nr:Hpt domain-containing protein [Desulfobacula sp.]MBU4132855.1 Hpt domain-containing protein [Pseudomonadota bacterium]
MPDSNKGDPVVDLDELKEIMDNDMELIQDCFAEFLTDLPDLLGEIQTAISQKDAGKMNTAGHKLKGTLKYLAAEPAAKAAQAIESAGSNHDLENLDEKFLTLEKECQNLTAFIEGFTP